MSYTIREGQRVLSFQASYAMRWSVTWANIFIDCPTCNQSIGLKFHGIDANEQSDAFSNKEFLQIVRSKGWAIIPNKHIACPSCRKAQGKLTQIP